MGAAAGLLLRRSSGLSPGSCRSLRGALGGTGGVPAAQRTLPLERPGHGGGAADSGAAHSDHSVALPAASGTAGWRTLVLCLLIGVGPFIGLADRPADYLGASGAALWRYRGRRRWWSARALMPFLGLWQEHAKMDFGLIVAFVVVPLVLVVVIADSGSMVAWSSPCAAGGSRAARHGGVHATSEPDLGDSLAGHVDTGTVGLRSGGAGGDCGGGVADAAVARSPTAPSWLSAASHHSFWLSD